MTDTVLLDEIKEMSKVLKTLKNQSEESYSIIMALIGWLSSQRYVSKDMVQKISDFINNEIQAHHPLPRKKAGDNYYCIDMDYTGIEVSSTQETYSPYTDSMYNTNNYFHTKERAEYIKDKISFLLKLERLHDEFCPGHIPVWDGETTNYCIDCVFDKNRYEVNSYTYYYDQCSVWFPSEEIAIKVCNILNKELEADPN